MNFERLVKQMNLTVEPIANSPYYNVVDLSKNGIVIRAAYCSKEEAALFAGAPQDYFKAKELDELKKQWFIKIYLQLKDKWEALKKKLRRRRRLFVLQDGVWTRTNLFLLTRSIYF